jgi:hypothetical protein
MAFSGITETTIAQATRQSNSRIRHIQRDVDRSMLLVTIVNRRRKKTQRKSIKEHFAERACGSDASRF